MKSQCFLFLAFALVINTASQPVHAQPTTNAVSTNATYVIPIKGAIMAGLLYGVDRQLTSAKEAGADTIILQMDTPGGALVIAEKLIRMLMDLPESTRVITYVDKDALSAGALIAMATDDIYMAPNSRIGASAVVLPWGDMEEGDMKEKAVSATLALVKSAAEQNGHDPNLVEAMVRRDYTYTIGEEVIVPEGELLTLNDVNAARLVERKGVKAPLLAAGKANDITDLLKKLGRDPDNVITPQLTPTDKLTRLAKTFALLFLILGVVGVYIEIKTPGFGIPGVLGIFMLMLFFWAQYIAGTAGTVEFLIFVFGAALLLLEIFVIPGFGIAGISGISLITLSIFMAMVQHFPGENLFSFPELQVSGALTRMAVVLLVSFLVMVILARYLPQTEAFSHIAVMKSLNHTDGYQASADHESLLGASGTAATALHPAGMGLFDGKRVNVVTRGEFIEKDTPIIVAETHGNRIVVDRVREMPSHTDSNA